MKCNVCKTKMKDATTEIEVLVNGRKVKALNVPAYNCPNCDEIRMDELIEKLVQTYAKGSKEATFDFAEVKPRGVGITLGKK